MAFLKISHDRAYATGGLRSNLPMRQLIGKLKRGGLPAEMIADRLVIRCGDDIWSFGDWQPDGIGRIGWLGMTVGGDVSALSRRLARIGLRHRIDYSRPFDVETRHVRSVTQYDFRWDVLGLAPPGDAMPSIVSFDEHL